MQMEKQAEHFHPTVFMLSAETSFTVEAAAAVPQQQVCWWSKPPRGMGWRWLFTHTQAYIYTHKSHRRRIRFFFFNTVDDMLWGRIIRLETWKQFVSMQTKSKKQTWSFTSRLLFRISWRCCASAGDIWASREQDCAAIDFIRVISSVSQF